MNDQREGTEVVDLCSQSSQNVVGDGDRKAKTTKAHSRMKRANANRKRNREGQVIEAQNGTQEIHVENVGTSDIASHNVVVIDVEQVKDKPVVDLTNESRDNVYVDLTSSPDLHPTRRQSVIHWQSTVPNTTEQNSKTTDAIVIVPSSSERVVNVMSEPTPISENIMTCAICMDDFSQIKKAKRQLTSTTCGHVFCSPCITSSLRAQAKCPTCRKKLTKKQLHPIFL